MALDITIFKDLLEIGGRILEWFSRFFRRQIRVKEINSKGDQDIHEVLDLYERIFDENDQINPSDLVAWLDCSKDDRFLSILEQCLIIAKTKDRVVSLLKCIYSPKTKWIYIAYFGIDKSEVVARKIASKVIFKFFTKYLRKKWNDSIGIVFEIEANTENPERNSRNRLFKDLARYHGYSAFKVDIDYLQPGMIDSYFNPCSNKKMELVIAKDSMSSKNNQKFDHIDRVEFLKLLKFIYFGVYGSTQVATDDQRHEYCKYLETMLNNLTEKIKDEIKLIA